MKSAIKKTATDLRPRKMQAPAKPYIEIESRARVTFRLPLNDADKGALADYQAANEHLRTVPWPTPFDRTIHRLHLGDARDLSWLPDNSVHLVVTSPPYWNLKEYAQG